MDIFLVAYLTIVDNINIFFVLYDLLTLIWIFCKFIPGYLMRPNWPNWPNVASLVQKTRHFRALNGHPFQNLFMFNSCPAEPGYTLPLQTV